jgi:hypothetical protein
VSGSFGGGAVFSTENLTLAQSTVTNNAVFFVDDRLGGTRPIATSGGGGILSEGSLTIVETMVSGNSTIGPFAGGGGVAVVGFSSLAIIDSSITDNSTEGRRSVGGGVFATFGKYQSEVTINGSIISGNSTTGDSANGGGIYSTRTSLTIERSTISGNSTTGSSAEGGGISFHSGRGGLTIRESTVSGNSTTGNSAEGGGIEISDRPDSEHHQIIGSTIRDNFTTASRSDGGGIYLDGGNLTVTSSTISNNSTEGGNGGGVFTRRGSSLTIENSTISGNMAIFVRATEENFLGAVGYGGFGGGIFSVAQSLTIQNSTISGNAAVGELDLYDPNGFFRGTAGGILDAGEDSFISNTTISGNFATNDGGGISSSNGRFGAKTIVHSTITNNTSDSDNNGTGSGGGLIINNGPVLLDHTIIAGNHDNSGVAPDVAGIVNSSFSLIGFGAQYLGPLDDNGGPTLTHALLPDSPAIDAGDPNLQPGVDGTPEFDQRGVPFSRIPDGRIDIGAFEDQPAGGSLNGDFDNDGDTDGSDFLAWQRGFGTTIGASRANGDATLSGSVDQFDLAVWESTFGTGVEALAATVSGSHKGESESAEIPTEQNHVAGVTVRSLAAVAAAFEQFVKGPRSADVEPFAPNFRTINKSATDTIAGQSLPLAGVVRSDARLIGRSSLLPVIASGREIVSHDAIGENTLVDAAVVDEIHSRFWERSL